MNFSSIIVGSVGRLKIGTTLKSGKVVEADSNGKAPFIINVSAGLAPNRTILSGTVGENLGLEDGHTYLFQVRETEISPDYGRQFNWTKLQEITSALEIVKVSNELGAAQVFDVATAEVVTPAVESTRQM